MFLKLALAWITAQRFLAVWFLFWVGPMGSPGRRLERGRRMRSGYLWPQLSSGSSEAGSVVQPKVTVFLKAACYICTTFSFLSSVHPFLHPLRPGGSGSSAVLMTGYWNTLCNSLPSHPYHVLWIESCSLKRWWSPHLQCLWMWYYLEIGSLQMIKLTWGHYSWP